MLLRFILVCVCVCVCMLVSQLCLTLQLHGLYPTRFLCPQNSPGKNTGMGCHSLLQGIFPTQGLNPGLLHCRQILYSLSHHGSSVYKNNSIVRISNILTFSVPGKIVIIFAIWVQWRVYNFKTLSYFIKNLEK